MASAKEFLDYILEQIELDSIMTRKMMGEYLLYYGGILFGGVYDNRLLVKITDTNSTFGMEKQIPYEGAKEMYMVSDLENREVLKNIVVKTCEGLAK